jgi:hypothetical protein
MLSAFVLTKMTAIVQFNSLDSVPSFRQIFAGTPVAKVPVTLGIPHPVSHFPAVFLIYRIWLRYCSLQDWLLLEHMPMRNETMETSVAADVEKDSDHPLWRDVNFSNACASPPLATVTKDGKRGSMSLPAWKQLSTTKANWILAGLISWERMR